MSQSAKFFKKQFFHVKKFLSSSWFSPWQGSHWQKKSRIWRVKTSDIWTMETPKGPYRCIPVWSKGRESKLQGSLDWCCNLQLGLVHRLEMEIRSALLPYHKFCWTVEGRIRDQDAVHEWNWEKERKKERKKERARKRWKLVLLIDTRESTDLRFLWKT